MAAARYVLVLFAVYFLLSKVSEYDSTELTQSYADVGFVALPLFAASEILPVLHPRLWKRGHHSGQFRRLPFVPSRRQPFPVLAAWLSLGVCLGVCCLSQPCGLAFRGELARISRKVGQHPQNLQPMVARLARLHTKMQLGASSLQTAHVLRVNQKLFTV